MRSFSEAKLDELSDEGRRGGQRSAWLHLPIRTPTIDHTSHIASHITHHTDTHHTRSDCVDTITPVLIRLRPVVPAIIAIRFLSLYTPPTMTSAVADATDGATVDVSAASIPIGIDLGHSYSVIGVWRNDSTDVIANELGNRSTPNIVAFTDKEILYGEPAHTQLATNLPNTLHHVKRLAGLHYHHPTVQSMKAKVDYTIQSVKSTGTTGDEEVAVLCDVQGRAGNVPHTAAAGRYVGQVESGSGSVHRHGV